MVGREMRPPHRDKRGEARSGLAANVRHVGRDDDDARRDAAFSTASAFRSQPAKSSASPASMATGRPNSARSPPALATDSGRLGVPQRRRRHPRSECARGAAPDSSFIPEDRLDRGLSATMTVAENLCAGLYRRKGLVGPGGVLRTGRARRLRLPRRSAASTCAAQRPRCRSDGSPAATCRRW